MLPFIISSHTLFFTSTLALFMKLLLTSAGLTTDKLQETLRGLLTKPTQKNKVLILELNWGDENYPKYLEETKQLLISTGFLPENLAMFDLSQDNPPDISQVDVLMIYAGNHFHYMKRIRETGLETDIRDFIERDGVYIGVSGGSVMMSPDMDDGLSMTKNEIGLEDMSGFGYINFYIVSHWDWREDKKEMLTDSWESGKRMIPLTDQQGILVLDNDFTII
jgi:peptidase E